MEQWTIDGISVEVTRKRIKNLYLRLDSQRRVVKLSLPNQVSDQAARAFLMRKLPWVKKHLSRYEEQTPVAKNHFATGDEQLLWGKSYPLKVLTGSRNAVTLTEDALLMETKGHTSRDQREKLLDDFYRVQLQGAIPSLYTHWAKIIGVNPSEWRIKKMKTRWGSCNIQQKRIWLSLHLAKFPPQCLEYVVVHELVHLLERGHNRRFYGFLDRYYPRWSVVKGYLDRVPRLA